jgi:hypothetical protein
MGSLFNGSVFIFILNLGFSFFLLPVVIDWFYDFSDKQGPHKLHFPKPLISASTGS